MNRKSDAPIDEKRVRLLVQHLNASTDVLVMELDSQGRISTANPGAMRILGITESALGRHIDDSNGGELWRRIQKTIASGSKSFRYTIREGNSDSRTLVFTPNELDQGILLMAERVIILEADIVEEMGRLNDELVNITRNLNKKNGELTRALERIKRLEGIIPICMYCHKTRDDNQAWQRLEA